MMTGKPSSPATCCPSSSDSTGPGEPGTVGTPCFLASVRLDAQLLARADHPQGDLPAVRDQHFLEHQGVSSIAPAASAPPSRFPDESTPDTLRANSLGFVA